MKLDALKVTNRPPTAEQYNALAAFLDRQFEHDGITDEMSAHRFPHPWRTRVQRLGERGSLPVTSWRVDVAAGSVNDELAKIAYLRTADPRGWSLPPGYETSDEDPTWIDRDALDDPDDPPFLVLADVPSADWTRISDEERPRVEGGAFCGAEDWEKELWRAHVLLSAMPLKPFYLGPEFPVPRLVRHRLYTSPRLPALLWGAAAGGWLEIARLYLQRDPQDPDNATVRVRQREWWPLWAELVAPGQEPITGNGPGLPPVFIPGFGAVFDQGDIFTGAVQSTINDMLASSRRVEWWTV